MDYATLVKVLELTAAATSAAAQAREVYNALRESAQQAEQLTPEQAAELDAKAEAVFSSPASQPSGR
jgi:hypothetical protein